MLQSGIKKLKIKPLTKEQLIISIERLTRFKDPEIKYLRVYKELITNNIIEPRIKKEDLDNMDYEELTLLAQDIINSYIPRNDDDLILNQKLYDYENSIFKLNENTNKLLKNQINYKSIINILPDNSADNLKWLKNGLCVQNSFGFPVKKIILCEGITEETLLPKFARLAGYDFKQNGINIISAGGKNQVVKYFYKFADILKIPIFVLLDNDAEENLRQILPKLRDFDKIHLLKNGEFEDILPNSLIIKTLDYLIKNISISHIENLNNCQSKVSFLEDFFKHRGLHEFKKSEFAQAVKENISAQEDISAEIAEIIKEIKGTKVPL